MIIYLLGGSNEKDPEQFQKNYEVAMNYAKKIIGLGHFPIIPHLILEPDSTLSEEQKMKVKLEGIMASYVFVMPEFIDESIQDEKYPIWMDYCYEDHNEYTFAEAVTWIFNNFTELKNFINSTSIIKDPDIMMKRS